MPVIELVDGDDPAISLRISLSGLIKLLGLLGALTVSSFAVADTAEWTWMSGSDTVSQAGIYGTQGVPLPDSVPGARYGSVSWADVDGRLWLMGGFGRDSAGNRGRLNDLWRYDSSGQWTWMSGSDTADQVGVYGVLGTPHPANVPGGRSQSISWKDADGNLWLMGGHGYDSAGELGQLNDLWRFDSNGEWAWMGGSDTSSQAGVYGTQGTPHPDNVPGARNGSVAWFRSDGSLWLMGGVGHDGAGDHGQLNDLWRYDGNGIWTWMSGSAITGQFGVYGTKGKPHPDNVPGARFGSISWLDMDGNLWLMGGFRESLFVLNDLWRYDDNGKWTWMSGSSVANQPGVYGTLGTPGTDNVPGTRAGSISWIDTAGNLWLMGGHGRDRDANLGPLNDLWRYDTNGQWTWMNGSSTAHQNGAYGTKGVPHPANVPGSRSHSVSWIDATGSLWLMGGSGRDRFGDSISNLNDLWRYGEESEEVFLDRFQGP